MENEFQKWMVQNGYTRENGGWMKENILVSGKELSDKLDEFKLIEKKLN